MSPPTEVAVAFIFDYDSLVKLSAAQNHLMRRCLVLVPRAHPAVVKLASAHSPVRGGGLITP